MYQRLVDPSQEETPQETNEAQQQSKENNPFKKIIATFTQKPPDRNETHLRNATNDKIDNVRKRIDVAIKQPHKPPNKQTKKPK